MPAVATWLETEHCALSGGVGATYFVKSKGGGK